jgi:hypothetical protein
MTALILHSRVKLSACELISFPGLAGQYRQLTEQGKARLIAFTVVPGRSLGAVLLRPLALRVEAGPVFRGLLVNRGPELLGRLRTVAGLGASLLADNLKPSGILLGAILLHLVGRERDFLTAGCVSRTMAYGIDCERGGPAARP